MRRSPSTASASQLQPDLADAHMGLGEILEFQGKRDDAILEYRTASQLTAQLADSHTPSPGPWSRNPIAGQKSGARRWSTFARRLL